MMEILELTEIKLRVSPLEKFVSYMTEFDSRIDRELLAGVIIKECGALAPMYQESYSFWLNHDLWCRSNVDVINHLCATMYYDYSPINNYNMEYNENQEGYGREDELIVTEENHNEHTDSSDEKKYKSTYHEAYSGKDTLKHDYASKIQDNGGEDYHGTTERDLQERVVSHIMEEDKTSAYNENLYQPYKTHETDSTVDTEQTGTVTDNHNIDTDNTRQHSGNDTDTTTFGKIKDSTVSDDLTEGEGTKDVQGGSEEIKDRDLTIGNTKDTNGSRFGSTGIYSKQQLIEQERKLAQFNLYQWIANKYRRDNIYSVY